MEPFEAIAALLVKVLDIVQAIIGWGKKIYQLAGYIRTIDSLDEPGGGESFLRNVISSYIVSGIINVATGTNGQNTQEAGDLKRHGEDFAALVVDTLNPKKAFGRLIEELPAPNLERALSRGSITELAIIGLEELKNGIRIGNGTQTVSNTSKGGDPVIFVTGEFERERTDLVILGAGIEFSFHRIYRSGATYFGPLGPSWDHSYNTRIRQESEFVVVLLAGGLSEQRFVRHPRFGSNGYDYYTPPNGVHDVIIPNGTGSYTLLKPGGWVYRFQVSETPEVFLISRIEDRLGNYLQFEYNSEERLSLVNVNSSERYVSFTYDPLNRQISHVRDHAGRVVVYEYDDQGYLSGVIGPAFSGEPGESKEFYEYDRVGRALKLARICDWQGRIIIENRYESNHLSEHYGKVISQRVNRGESYFMYEFINNQADSDASSWDIPSLRVWETKRNGHQLEHILNCHGNALCVRENFVQEGRIREIVCRYRYNADGRIVAMVNPEGVLTQYLYGREHLSFIDYADVEHVLGDVKLHERMGFGNLLAEVVRGQRVAPGGAALDPVVAGEHLPSVKLRHHQQDFIIKYGYDSDSQLLICQSDPRHTRSADPDHVESAHAWSDGYDPDNSLYIDHQRHLTRYVYRRESRFSGPESRYILHKKIFPDRTRPSHSNGFENITDIFEEIRKYDQKGRPLEWVDANGYTWFNKYYKGDGDVRRGFLQTQLIPHIDWVLCNTTPDILEIKKNGDWHAFDLHLISSGSIRDSIKFSAEGTRISIYQSANLSEIISRNTEVIVIVDGDLQPAWDQGTDSSYVIENLSCGVHAIEIQDTEGMPVSVGRIRTYVALHYDVDDLGRVCRQTDARGFVTAFKLDARGRVKSATHGADANRSVVHREFDPKGHIIYEREEWRDENGDQRPELAITRRYRYDESGLLIGESAGAQKGNEIRISRHRYDPSDNLRVTINPKKVRTHFFYDALNRPNRTVRLACSDRASASTTQYDLAGHLLSKKNARGALHFNGFLSNNGLWQSGIDTRGRVRVQTDPLGNMIVTEHDELSDPTVVRQFQKRPDGQYELLSRRVNEYDEHGDVVRITEAIFNTPIPTADPIRDPDNEFFSAVRHGDVQSACAEFFLDALGNRIGERNPNGGLRTKRFDGRGRVFEEINAEGRRIFRIFDGAGNSTRSYIYDPVVDAQTDNISHFEVFVQTYQFDEFNRQTAKIDPYGNRWESKYDSLGHLTRILDPMENIVRYKHNAFGEEVCQINELMGTDLGGHTFSRELTSQRQYDENGNLSAVIDPLGRRTEFIYDALDRLVTVDYSVDADQPKELRGYDAANNLVFIQDRNGLIKNMTFDLLNRITRIDIDTSGVKPQNEISPHSATYHQFQYDGAGNIIRHDNDFCAVNIHRESRGLPTLEKVQIKNIRGAPESIEFGRRFDLAGNRVTSVYPSGRKVIFNYDQEGRVKLVKNLSAANYCGRISNANNFILARYTYAGRRLSQIDYGNQMKFKLRYDGRGQAVDSCAMGPDGNLIWRQQRLSDAAGSTRMENTTTRRGDRTRKFFFDSVYRLAHYVDEPTDWFDSEMLAPAERPFEPSGLDKQNLTDALIGSLALPAGLHTFEYDDLGNRLQTREAGMAPFNSWPNELNQYVEVDGNPWTYDANGNLLTNTDYILAYDSNNQLQEITSHTGQGIIYHRDALGRVIAETKEDHTVFRAYDGGALLCEISSLGQKEFCPGNQANAILHAAISGEDYWLSYDRLLSLRLVTDSASRIIAAPSYRPYGAEEGNDLTVNPVNFGFAGTWYTKGAPFYHSKHRSYDPNTGRHLQRDPLGPFDTLNPYVYASNNPVDQKDPTGLSGEQAAPAMLDMPLEFSYQLQLSPETEYMLRSMQQPEPPGLWNRLLSLPAFEGTKMALTEAGQYPAYHPGHWLWSLGAGMALIGAPSLLVCDVGAAGIGWFAETIDPDGSLSFGLMMATMETPIPYDDLIGATLRIGRSQSLRTLRFWRSTYGSPSRRYFTMYDESLEALEKAGWFFADTRNIWLNKTLPRVDRLMALRHERAHRWLNPRHTAFSRDLRLRLWSKGYRQSHFLKGTEEMIAETYAWSKFGWQMGIRKGVPYPFRSAGVDKLRYFAELGGFAGIEAAAMYGSYRLSSAYADTLIGDDFE